MHEGQSSIDWLRSTRWKPPGAAARTAARKRTYQTALQQSEESFWAARQVSATTQPILAFYGLSQAGRAIAAAASNATKDEWKLEGHGIRAVDLAGDLRGVALRTDAAGSRGSFVRLSSLLDSPVWGQTAVPFEALWDSLPENAAPSQALHDDHRSRRCPLEIATYNHDEPHSMAVGLVTGLPNWLPAEPDIKAAFEAYLGTYPGTAGYHSYLVDNVFESDESGFARPTGAQVPSLRVDSDGRLYAQMNWEMPTSGHAPQAERDAYLRGRGSQHAADYFFYPEISAVGAAIHPLMCWWAVLYALSMLARYEPATWTKHLNLNESRYAYPVERLLDEALGRLPALIVEAIEQVSQSSAHGPADLPSADKEHEGSSPSATPEDMNGMQARA